MDAARTKDAMSYFDYCYHEQHRRACRAQAELAAASTGEQRAVALAALETAERRKGEILNEASSFEEFLAQS
jgi:hypothetical protein